MCGACKMTLNCYPVPGKAKSDMICRVFEFGAPKSAKGSVFFGTEGQMTAFERAKAGTDPWYYIDNSYFDKHRGIYFRVTKNALQVDPRGKTSDGKRFAKLGIPIKERQTTGAVTLLVPQSDQFMKSVGAPGWALGASESALKWLEEGDAAFSFKVHPWDRNKDKRNATFAEMLPSIRLVITHSSAAAITAILEGVPAISTSATAAAYAVGGPFDPLNVHDPVLPSVEERQHFASVLADNQFTLEEFRNGTAWRWLNG